MREKCVIEFLRSGPDPYDVEDDHIRLCRFHGETIDLTEASTKKLCIRMVFKKRTGEDNQSLVIGERGWIPTNGSGVTPHWSSVRYCSEYPPSSRLAG